MESLVQAQDIFTGGLEQELAITALMFLQLIIIVVLQLLVEPLQMIVLPRDKEVQQEYLEQLVREWLDVLEQLVHL